MYLLELPSKYLFVKYEDYGDLSTFIPQKRVTFLLEKKDDVDMKKFLQKMTFQWPKDEMVDHILKTVHETFVSRQRDANIRAPQRKRKAEHDISVCVKRW